MSLTEEEKAKIIEEEALRQDLRSSKNKKLFMKIGGIIFIFALPFLISMGHYYIQSDKQKMECAQGMVFGNFGKILIASQGGDAGKIDKAINEKCTYYQRYIIGLD